MIIAVQLLLNGFVLRRAGVEAAEHVIPTLVPLAGVALFAVVAPRWRPGARALGAFALGAIALVRAVLGLAGLLGGASVRADWPALVGIPAGTVLIVAATREAWRSRRSGPHRRLIRSLKAVLLVVGAYWLLFPVAIAVIATNTPPSRSTPPDLGRPGQQVTLTTSDGLDLAADYVPSRNGAAVIAYPGRSGPVRQARLLVEHGYGVLLIDMRGRGGSEGDPNALGWGARRDIDAAVAFLRRQPDVTPDRIAGLGLSVGGEVMIEAAATNPGLRAVISEGAGERSVRETVLLGPRGWFTLPDATVQTAAVWLLSGDRPPVALDDAARRIAPRSLFLIYGSRGQGIERDLNPRYYAAASSPKLIWEAAGAGHTDAIGAQPAEYEQRVIGFLEAVLGAG